MKIRRIVSNRIQLNRIKRHFSIASRFGAAYGADDVKQQHATHLPPERMTTFEAIPELQKYLDDAYLAHLPQARVVHGRGTGALRKAVHQQLKKLKYVESFRLGEVGEGQDGVTIVFFKSK